MKIEKSHNIFNPEEIRRDRDLDAITHARQDDLYVNFKGELKYLPKRGVNGCLNPLVRGVIRILYGINNDIVVEKIRFILEKFKDHISTQSEDRRHEIMVNVNLLGEKIKNKKIKNKIPPILTSLKILEETIKNAPKKDKILSLEDLNFTPDLMILNQMLNHLEKDNLTLNDIAWENSVNEIKLYGKIYNDLINKNNTSLKPIDFNAAIEEFREKRAAQ
ncbi:MAG: hypothetical protein V4494_06195 [Chlamydiota bacterium]